MPIISNDKPYQQSPEYFPSLTKLDEYYSGTVQQKHEGVIPYIPRRSSSKADGTGRGKLLVCHDYKGGYTESPSAPSYTFNFWDRCDTFIYFSHQRVTIPPSGWINAAHRQGSKMLGTLIFEHTEGAEDCLKLLVGKLPSSRTGPAGQLETQTIPVSPHYARLLADIAYVRGFDGYLLNVEVPLQGGPEQVRALDTWITLLRSELRARIGPTAQLIWYDSVVITGHLRWQDRLNSLNLPFFISSDSFFTNYTWPPHYPGLCAQYFHNLSAELVSQGPKSLSDIFIGVDVWGRGSHGNGGFGSYKAITHASPQDLGLSVALFGPAWTWESEQDKPGWNWDVWWAYERKLWLGPEAEGEHVDVPPEIPGQYPCPHGDFQPIASFFERESPPNASVLPLLTYFSSGIGFSWFIEGKKVMHKDSGWTDVDKQTSLGDWLWPRPSIAWEGEINEGPLPKSKTSIYFDDAWNGGSSVRVTLSNEGTALAEDTSFHCIWVPVQSCTFTPSQSYDIAVMLKCSSNNAEMDLGLTVKSNTDSSNIDISDAQEESFAGSGWMKVTGSLVFPGDASTKEATAVIGLVVGVVIEDFSQPYEVTIQLGQLSFTPSPLKDVVSTQARIVWADHQTLTDTTGAAPRSHSVVTWDVSASLGPLTQFNIGSTDDPNPAWIINQLPRWFPTFAYFNIWCTVRTQACSPEQATFIGTSGLDGVSNQFIIERSTLPGSLAMSPIRVYIQGVTSTGNTLPWSQCAYVDVD